MADTTNWSYVRRAFRNYNIPVSAVHGEQDLDLSKDDLLYTDMQPKYEETSEGHK
jgi:hypothetical protein